MTSCRSCGSELASGVVGCDSCRALAHDAASGRGTFVGREQELESVRAAMDAALAGQARIVLIGGEAGIGKTRLAEELAWYGEAAGAPALWGRCDETEGAPAYWPWVQILRAYVRTRDATGLLHDLGGAAADIARVAPELAGDTELAGRVLEVGAEQERFRIFESMLALIAAAAARAPLVIVIDDAHWADEASLLLLQFLARHLRDARWLAVVTYRDTPTEVRPAMARALAELARSPIVRRLTLTGLDERDVARFIERATGVAPARTLVRAVLAETEGNPFFMGEVVRLLVSQGELRRVGSEGPTRIRVPDSVRDVILSRLARLSAPCNRALSAAAVAGPAFRPDAVAEASGLTQEETLAAIEEAMGAGIVKGVGDPAGRLRFSHVLFRETLYDSLSPPRRALLHRQLGEILERVYGAESGEHLGELAHHFMQSEPGSDIAGRARDYAERAARRAVDQLAYEEGSRLYGMALRALEQEDPGDAARRCEILLGLGGAQVRAGQSAFARETFVSAASLAKEIGSAERLAAAALGYGGLGFQAGLADETLIALLQDALAALPDADAVLRARVLSRLGRELYFTRGEAPHLRLVRDAVAMARRIDDPLTLAYTLYGQHFILSGAAGGRPEFIDERLAVASEIVTVAERLGDREMELHGHHRRLRDLLEFGDIAGADDEIAAYERIAGELRQPHYLWQACGFRTMRALLDGRFGEAERLAQETLIRGTRAESPNVLQGFGVQIYPIRSEQQRLREIEPGLRVFVQQYAAVPAWRAGLAYLYAQLGKLDEAREHLDALASAGFEEMPQDAQFMPAIAYLADACAALSAREHAQTLYDLLLPRAGRNIVVGDAFACMGATDHYLGVLTRTLGHQEAAVSHFEAALTFNERLRSPPLTAYTQLQYALLLLETGAGPREHAMALLRSALVTARRLGMNRLRDQAGAAWQEAAGDSSIDALAAAVDRDRPDLSAHAAPDGGVTILFTDIESSTEMNERYGDARWMELLRAHNAVIRRELKRVGGVEVKSQGDGFMAAFTSPQQALLCAIGIQRAIHRDAMSARQDGLLVRIGMHSGEVIEEANDFFGKNVALAARIARAAAGGEILISGRVRELAGDAFSFGEVRTLRFKGFREPQDVYALAWQERPASSH